MENMSDRGDVQILHLSEDRLKFQVPVRILFAGPSGSGKSTMVLKLLQHRERMFNKPFNNVLYCCRPNPSSKDVEFYAQLKLACPLVSISHDFPNFKQLSFQEGNKLVILDDMLLEIVDNKELFLAITQASAHHSISLMITSQNYYHAGKYYKTLHRNMTEKIIFVDRGEKRWLSNLSAQMFPQKAQFLPSVMEWIRANVEGSFNHYFVIDSNPQSSLPDSMAVRTRILPQKNTNQIEPLYFSPRTI